MLQREESATKTPEGLSGGGVAAGRAVWVYRGSNLRDLGAYSAHFQIGVTNTKALLSHLIHEGF